MKILGVCLLLGSLQAIPEPRIPERYTEPTASVGNGAYNTAQVTKATAKFLHWTRIRNVTWQFDDWNSWRERDGMLCRKSSDCWWLDGDLRCGELTIGENKPNQSWFGGDSASIVGQCMCSYMSDSWYYYVGWNEVELECQKTSTVYVQSEAYDTSQMTKATAKFLQWSHNGSWQFDDWNSWRKEDGMLCRTSSDCSWLDDNLYCREVDNINNKNKSQSWFRGDSSSIVGQCSCNDAMSSLLPRKWYTTELRCWITTYFWFIWFIVSPCFIVGVSCVFGVLQYCGCCIFIK